MENPCVTEVGWWIFKSKEVIHTWRRTHISKFMSSSDTFHEHWKCKVCGATKTDRFVEYDDLLKRGASVEELENL